MAREIKDLQKLIEERAAKKLDSDLKAFAKMVNSSPMLPSQSYVKELLTLHITVNKGTPSQRQDPTHIHELFEISNYDGDLRGSFLLALQKYWLPIYIERESVEFLQKVDQVEQDVNYLLNNQPT